MGTRAKAVFGHIDRQEADEADQGTPFEDIYLLPIPMPLYKSLSNVASKRNMTVAQLIARGLEIAIKE